MNDITVAARDARTRLALLCFALQVDMLTLEQGQLTAHEMHLTHSAFSHSNCCLLDTFYLFASKCPSPFFVDLITNITSVTATYTNAIQRVKSISQPGHSSSLTCKQKQQTPEKPKWHPPEQTVRQPLRLCLCLHLHSASATSATMQSCHPSADELAPSSVFDFNQVPPPVPCVPAA